LSNAENLGSWDENIILNPEKEFIFNTAACNTMLYMDSNKVYSFITFLNSETN
jgi:hypothetical protein